jgi:hypothetical protein
MTAAVALFTTSGNDPAYRPRTPFQILYVRGAAEGGPGFDVVTAPDGGLLITGASSFQVQPGTMFYLPLWNADDSWPFPSPFPATHADAIGYVFGRDSYGGEGFTVTVDGHTTPLGAAYLAGPVTTPPLLDDDPRDPHPPGTHMLTLGAFLQPMTPGTHTVVAHARASGAALPATYELPYIEDTFTYTIEVRQSCPTRRSAASAFASAARERMPSLR